jgi:hypothetical protein
MELVLTSLRSVSGAIRHETPEASGQSRYAELLLILGLEGSRDVSSTVWVFKERQMPWQGGTDERKWCEEIEEEKRGWQGQDVESMTSSKTHLACLHESAEVDRDVVRRRSY